MQRKFQIVGLLAMVTLFSGCWKKSENVDIVAKNDTIRVINVLDENYFADAHIPGSLNISLDNLEKDAEGWNKDADIVIYCANYKCSASAAAVRKLMALGFTNVKAYESGMAGWAQAGLPVEGVAQEAYLMQANDKPEHASENDEDKKDESEAVESETEKNDVAEITTDELANLLGVQKANS